MKKIISLFLVLGFILSMPFPAFAKTLEYKDIEEEVLENNLQIKNNKATIKNLKLNRVVPNTGFETDKAMESAIEGMDNITANPMVSPDVAIIAQSTKMSLSMLNEILNSMTSPQGSVSGYNQQLNLTKIQLEHADKQIVNATKGLFATWHQLISNLEVLNASKENMALSVNAVKVRASLGLATALEVSEQEKSYNSLVVNITDLENQIIIIKGEINKMLGRSFNEELTAGKLPEPDLKYIDSINPEKDFVSAKSKSYDLIYLNKEYDYLKKNDSTVSYNNRMIKRNEITAEEGALMTSLVQKKNDILKQKANLEIENKKLSDEEKKYSDIEKKYALGMASGIEVKFQKNTLKSQKASVEIAKSTLFLEIENYKAILEGISV